MKVCMVAEGCYPFVVGGVSSWVHSLIQLFPKQNLSSSPLRQTVPSAESMRMSCPKMSPPSMNSIWTMWTGAEVKNDINIG